MGKKCTISAEEAGVIFKNHMAKIQTLNWQTQTLSIFCDDYMALLRALAKKTCRLNSKLLKKALTLSHATLTLDEKDDFSRKCAVTFQWVLRRGRDAGPTRARMAKSVKAILDAMANGEAVRLSKAGGKKAKKMKEQEAEEDEDAEEEPEEDDTGLGEIDDDAEDVELLMVKEAKKRSIWDTFGIQDPGASGASSSHQPPPDAQVDPFVVSSSDGEDVGEALAEAVADGLGEEDAGLSRPASPVGIGRVQGSEFAKVLYTNPLGLSAMVMDGDSAQELPLSLDAEFPEVCVVRCPSGRVIPTSTPSSLLARKTIVQGKPVGKIQAKAKAQKKMQPKHRVTRKRPAAAPMDDVDLSKVNRVLFTNASSPPRSYLQSVLVDGDGKLTKKLFLVEVRQNESDNYAELTSKLHELANDLVSDGISHEELKDKLLTEKASFFKD